MKKPPGVVGAKAVRSPVGAPAGTPGCEVGAREPQEVCEEEGQPWTGWAGLMRDPRRLGGDGPDQKRKVVCTRPPKVPRLSPLLMP